jgi:hypothetical protein
VAGCPTDRRGPSHDTIRSLIPHPSSLGRSAARRGLRGARGSQPGSSSSSGASSCWRTSCRLSTTAGAPWSRPGRHGDGARRSRVVHGLGAGDVHHPAAGVEPLLGRSEGGNSDPASRFEPVLHPTRRAQLVGPPVRAPPGIDQGQPAPRESRLEDRETAGPADVAPGVAEADLSPPATGHGRRMAWKRRRVESSGRAHVERDAAVMRPRRPTSRPPRTGDRVRRTWTRVEQACGGEVARDVMGRADSAESSNTISSGRGRPLHSGSGGCVAGASQTSQGRTVAGGPPRVGGPESGRSDTGWTTSWRTRRGGAQGPAAWQAPLVTRGQVRLRSCRGAAGPLPSVGP